MLNIGPLMDCSFTYDHFQRTQQHARGERKVVFSVDIRCIRTSSKAACSVHPIVDKLLRINVWKGVLGEVKVYPGVTCTFHAYFRLK